MWLASHNAPRTLYHWTGHNKRRNIFIIWRNKLFGSDLDTWWIVLELFTRKTNLARVLTLISSNLISSEKRNGYDQASLSWVTHNAQHPFQDDKPQEIPVSIARSCIVKSLESPTRLSTYMSDWIVVVPVNRVTIKNSNRK